MKKLLYFCLMLFPLVLYAEDSPVEQPLSVTEPAQPSGTQETQPAPAKPVVTSESLLHSPALLEAMQKITADRDLHLIFTAFTDLNGHN